MKLIRLFIIVGSFIVYVVGYSQEDNTDKKSNNQIAKELANPNATLGSMAFPIDFIFYSGTLPDVET